LRGLEDILGDVRFSFYNIVSKAKGKIHPRSGHEGAEVLSVRGEKVNILGHNIGHSKQKHLNEHVSYSERFARYSYWNAHLQIC
jgi:hypothetical protein